MPEFYKATRGWTQSGHPATTITFDNTGKYAVIFTNASYNSSANAIDVYTVPKLITGTLTANGCTYEASPNGDYYLVNVTSAGATLTFNRTASNISVCGYNITAGGEGINGYIMSQKERERRSECYKGKNNPFYNCKHTSETRKLMSLHHYDCSGDNNPHNKHIFMFDLDGCFLKEYISITDACKDNNTTDCCIIHAIQEKRQGNNYFWGYKEDIIIDTNNDIKLKYNYRRIHKRDKQVEQYTLDNQYVQTYKNITNAAEQINGSRQGIIAYSFYTKKWHSIWL